MEVRHMEVSLYIYNIMWCIICQMSTKIMYTKKAKLLRICKIRELNIASHRNYDAIAWSRLPQTELKYMHRVLGNVISN